MVVIRHGEVLTLTCFITFLWMSEKQRSTDSWSVGSSTVHAEVKISTIPDTRQIFNNQHVWFLHLIFMRCHNTGPDAHHILPSGSKPLDLMGYTYTMGNGCGYIYVVIDTDRGFPFWIWGSSSLRNSFHENIIMGIFEKLCLFPLPLFYLQVNSQWSKTNEWCDFWKRFMGFPDFSDINARHYTFKRYCDTIL